MQQAGQVPYLDQNDAHEQSLGQSDGSLPGPEQTLNQSINQSINMAANVNIDISTLTCQTGFDRAFRNLGVAPCQGPDAEGACPLFLCDVVHYVLVNSRNAGGCPLPFLDRQGQRAQPPGDLRGLSNPDVR